MMPRTPTQRTVTGLLLVAALTATGCGGGRSPVAPPSTTTTLLAAMETAIQDEYRAEAIYQGVLDDFGSVLPFVNVLYAEQRPSTSIGQLYLNRGLAVPASLATPSSVPHFATLAAACAAAVEAERANLALYDRYLAQQLPADVERVFTNNRSASLHNHLPAFEICR